jgi:hypothetical protein
MTALPRPKKVKQAERIAAMIASRRCLMKPPERIRKKSKRDKLKHAIMQLIDGKSEMMAVAQWSATRKNRTYDVEFRALAKHLDAIVQAIDSVPAKAPSAFPEGDLRVLGIVANYAIQLKHPAKMAEMARHVARKEGRQVEAVRTQLKRMDRDTLAWFNRVPNSDHEVFSRRLMDQIAKGT